MLSVGFKPSIPAMKWLQIYILDGVATGIEVHAYLPTYLLTYLLTHSMQQSPS